MWEFLSNVDRLINQKMLRKSSPNKTTSTVYFCRKSFHVCSWPRSNLHFRSKHQPWLFAILSTFFEKKLVYFDFGYRFSYTLLESSLKSTDLGSFCHKHYLPSSHITISAIIYENLISYLQDYVVLNAVLFNIRGLLEIISHKNLWNGHDLLTFWTMHCARAIIKHEV